MRLAGEPVQAVESGEADERHEVDVDVQKGQEALTGGLGDGLLAFGELREQVDKDVSDRDAAS